MAVSYNTDNGLITSFYTVLLPYVTEPMLLYSYILSSLSFTLPTPIYVLVIIYVFLYLFIVLGLSAHLSQHF